MAWPANVLTRVVTGNYVTATGAASSGRISFTPSSRVVDQNDAVIVEDTITVVLDENGEFSVELPTTDNTALNPTGWAYEVSVRLHGLKPQKFYAFLPYSDGSPVSLNNEISTKSEPADVSTSPFASYNIEVSSTDTPGEWPNDVVTRTITGTYVNASGAAAQGRVTFTPTSRVVDENDSIIIEDTITATLDSSGSFSVDLPTTDNPLLSPENWAYEVRVRLYGVQPRKFYILLPYGDGSDVDIINSVSATASDVADSTEQSTLLRGPVGPRGPGVITGSGLPGPLDGFDGDIYIDSDNGFYYGPKVDGVWPATPLFSATQTLRHIHTQAVASTTWTVSHLLGGYPSVTVVDTAGTVVYGEISYSSTTEVVLSFSAAFAGYAYLT